MVVDEDNPSVLLGELARDAMAHDSGAPWKIGALVVGARVEPDLHTWGADLVSTVADMVCDYVEGSRLLFNGDVCPWVNFFVVGGGLGSAVGWGVGYWLPVAWSGGSVTGARSPRGGWPGLGT